MSLSNGDGAPLGAAVTNTFTKQTTSNVHGEADSGDPELLAGLRELRSAAVRLLVVCEHMEDELDGPGPERAAA